MTLTKIIDDHTQAKRTSELQAWDKVKHREVLARKHEQASKAAETDPLMALSLIVLTRSHTVSPNPLNLDNAVSTRNIKYILLMSSQFSTRSLGNVHATNHSMRPSMLTTALTVHKARVPPVTRMDRPLELHPASQVSAKVSLLHYVAEEWSDCPHTQHAHSGTCPASQVK